MAKANRKVIITCAVTGAIHTPSMSPHLPVTPDEIAEAAIAAAEAGAAILHLHARDPETGRPTQDPAVFEQFLPRIKQSTNAAINITTGGSPHMTVEERMRPAAVFKPEVASMNMGSMNFGLYPMLDRFSDFTHDWERAHLENSRDLVFKNTFSDIETIMRVGNDNGTRFEFECYDISHLYNLAHFVQRRLVRPPFFIQSTRFISAHHLARISRARPSASAAMLRFCRVPAAFRIRRANVRRHHGNPVPDRITGHDE